MTQILLWLFFLTNQTLEKSISQKICQPNQQQSIYSLNDFTLTKPFNLNSNDLTAKSVLVKEIGGQTLYDSNADQRRPIASLSKLMTALISVQLYKPNQIFTINQKTVNEYPGDIARLTVGEKLTRDDLLQLALIGSSNNAAYALAQGLGVDKFVQIMNSRAKSLGMNQTAYYEPTGLDPGNQSTLDNLYRLADFILRDYPQIFAFSREDSFSVGPNSVINIDYLLPYYKNIIIGSKTGYIGRASGENLILILKFKKSPFIFVGLLDSQNRDKDGEYIIKKLQDYYE